jgi:winged helix DNA-binding protein
VAAERILSRRELNRALLERQLLLERANLSIPRALERVGGIQAQYAPSMYIGLWSRLAGFERDKLTKALERRSVVQGTLMRTTIHLVSAPDYWPFALAIRRGRQAHWLRNHRGVNASSMTRAAKRLRPALAGKSLRSAEIEELLGREHGIGAGLWLDLLRVPPSGTWERRRADVLASAEDWLGPPDITPEQGLELLVRRYLGSFGPATRKDIAGWAGLPVAEIAPALDRLRLRTFRSESGELLLDLPRAPLPDPDVPVPVRFLPVWDATLLVHARRAGILPERYRPRVFNTKTPHSVNTFIVDGMVAGTWKHESGSIRLEPYGRLDRSTRRELEEEGERLAAVHGP